MTAVGHRRKLLEAIAQLSPTPATPSPGGHPGGPPFVRTAARYPKRWSESQRPNPRQDLGVESLELQQKLDNPVDQ